MRRVREELANADEPFWLQQAADRWMQFADHKGRVYYQNMSTGKKLGSLADVLDYENPEVAFKGADPTSGRCQIRSSTDHVQIGTVHAMADLVDAHRVEHLLQHNSLPDHLVRTSSLGALFQTSRQMLAISVATAPRSVRHTLDVARAYGLIPLKEVEYLWLADIAIALPVPAGWIEHDHPTEGMPYWHNELAGFSQWQHPVDDYIKGLIKMQRAPSHPQVRMMRVESLERETPTLLTGNGKFAPAMPSALNAFEPNPLRKRSSANLR